MSWYKKGDEGYQALREREEHEAEERSRRVFRVWLREGEKGKFTFLDNDGFFYKEHNLKLRGKWGNFFTCPGDYTECPLCDSGERASSVAAFTVIDHRPYEVKHGPDKGKIRKNVKKLLVVKRGALHKLMDRRQKLGEKGLLYGVFEFARFSATECNTGEQFDFLGKRFSPDKLKTLAPKGADPDEWIKPFDYFELLAPRSVEELRKVVGQVVVGADSGTTKDNKTTDTDDVDFSKLTENEEVEGEDISLDDLL